MNYFQVSHFQQSVNHAMVFFGAREDQIELICAGMKGFADTGMGYPGPAGQAMCSALLVSIQYGSEVIVYVRGQPYYIINWETIRPDQKKALKICFYTPELYPEFMQRHKVGGFEVPSLDRRDKWETSQYGE